MSSFLTKTQRTFFGVASRFDDEVDAEITVRIARWANGSTAMYVIGASNTTNTLYVDENIYYLDVTTNEVRHPMEQRPLTMRSSICLLRRDCPARLTCVPFSGFARALRAAGRLRRVDLEW